MSNLTSVHVTSGVPDSGTGTVSTIDNLPSLLLSATAASDASRLAISELDSVALAGSVTSAATLFTQDMTGYKSASVHVTSNGTTCTITYETSNDNSTWVSTSGSVSVNTGSSTAVTTTTTATMTVFPRRGRYFRARVSTYTSGTVTVVGELSKISTTIINASTVVATSTTGSIAVGGTITTTPVAIGTRAITAQPTAVTNGQVGHLQISTIGALSVKPFSVPELDWTYPAALNGISNTTTAVTIAAAAGAGLRNYITGIQLDSDALGSATEFAIRDGAAGTVIWRVKIGTAGLGSGLTLNFLTPLKSTANTLLEVVTLTASITGAVYFNAQGYIAP